MKLMYSPGFLSRKPQRQLHSSSTYEIPSAGQFWRPSRWFRRGSNPSLRGPQIPFLYRFQRKNLIDYIDKRNFSSKTHVGSPPVFPSPWYGKKSLAKWTKTSLKWTPIPIVFAVVALIYRQLTVKGDDRHLPSAVDSAETSVSTRNLKKPLPWHVPTVFYIYQFLPLRALSRSWGWLNDLYLPHWLRRPVLSSYVRMFGCDLSEAAIQDLKWYKNLGEFFRRHLRPGVRPIDRGSSVVSPSDGIVLHVGRVEDDCVEQVKGMTYSLAAFLGPRNWFTKNVEEESIVEEDDAPEPSSDYRSSLRLRQKSTDLYHCVIYLAPGDYHRFHSPANWKIFFRRHFPGHLFSVSPSVTRRIEGLFNYNERVVYYGTWQHGFFSMAAVGATNVGSIRVYFDERLKTNNKRYKRGAYQDWNFAQHKAPSPTKGVGLQKGDEFGEFNLGSTIVLLFEAPKDFKFNVDVGQQVRYGKPLGHFEGSPPECTAM